jgi:hypothetical protein
MFPEEIRDNYEEIIIQSFENYSDDKVNITLTLKLDEPIQLIIINFQYKVKPFSFKRSISIPIFYHLKDFKDYTNERIENLENEIKILRVIIEDLKDKNNNKIDDSEEDNDDDEEEDNDEEDDDDDNKKEEVVHIPIKGGKQHPATLKKISAELQMKGGRQGVKNK